MPTQKGFLQPRMDMSAYSRFLPTNNISPTQDFYPLDRNPTQMFYPPRQFVNAPQKVIIQPDLTSTKGLPTLDLQSLPANMGVANEDDERQVDSLTGEKKGLANIFDFLQQFSPMQMIGKGIGAFFNPKESDRYTPAPMGVYGYTPAQLNQMNALGGYYSEPMRAYRRNTNRISNMLQRGAAGKSFSQKNLDRLLNQAGLGGVDTRGMMDSIKASSQTGYGGYGSRKAASEAAARGGGRDYSSSPGAMAGDMEYGEE